VANDDRHLPPHQRRPQLVRGVEGAGADALISIIVVPVGSPNAVVICVTVMMTERASGALKTELRNVAPGPIETDDPVAEQAAAS